MRRTPGGFSRVVSGPRRPSSLTRYSTSARATPPGRSSKRSRGSSLRRTVARLIWTVPTGTWAMRKTASSSPSVTATLRRDQGERSEARAEE